MSNEVDYDLPYLQAKATRYQDFLQGDILQGDGMERLIRALEEVEQNQEQVRRNKMLFLDHPPRYVPGCNTMRGPYETPGQRLRRLREWEQRNLERDRKLRYENLERERRASKPYAQFRHEIGEDEARMYRGELPFHSDEANRQDFIYGNIEARWTEQGIWNSKWPPLELESESRTESEAEYSTEQLNPRRSKDVDRRIIQEPERGASRPYYQFLYQISKKRERIEKNANPQTDASVGTAGINTKAYEAVKEIWCKRGIWNTKWGILPGMSWKHEEPIDEEYDPVSNLPTVAIGSDFDGVFPVLRFAPRPTPVRSRPYHLPGVVFISRQPSPVDTNPTGLENGNAKSSSSTPKTLFSVTDQALRPRKGKSSIEDGYTQPMESVLLDSTHSSPVPEVPEGTGKGTRRPHNGVGPSQRVPSGNSLLLTNPNVAEPVAQPSSITPRRSERVKRQADHAAKIPISAKSKGVSKRKRLDTRGRSREVE